VNRIFLVAARDFRQIAATRGFRIMLLGLPLLLAASIFATRLLAPPASVAYILVDATGQYAPALEHRIELDYQRQILADLFAYTQRWNVKPGPDAIWSSSGRWSSDQQVESFITRGGVAAALRQIQPQIPANAPVFRPRPRAYLQIPPPRGVPTDEGADRFGAGVSGFLRGDVPTPAGNRPLALAIYVPKEFGQPGVPIRIWTNGSVNAGLIGTVRAELTRTTQLRALEASGLDAVTAARIRELTAPVDVTDPPAGEGRQRVVIRSAVPFALVYILLMAAVITGQMMLQGVIEERSNKLVESVLACIRPGELMCGKLLGLGAIGLTIVSVWIGCALAAAFSVQGPVADFLRPALGSLNEPWMIGALFFYFLAGYLTISMVFLAVGSLSNSMQDASAYLMPVVWVVMVPIFILMSTAIRNPGGLFPQILSWIPIYTPFAMLARLGSGVSVLEVVGTGALLIVFVALEILLLGRVFQASLLSSGQPPNWAAFAKLMFPARTN
jgi:ABC-2 type transport system permease protein